ncbi:MAG: HlyD family efflux transporter periplasmic adaptor subunit [Bdellovibrionales bacterium]|nr:HlyD family efflux transporter periplasmic adaptor subunit [Bdellovibrionales bacterium]
MSFNKSILALLFISSIDCLGIVNKPEVIVVKANESLVKKTLTFPGVTKSQKQSNILAETSGVIRRIQKQLGATVRRGDVLAWIENPDPVYQYKPLPIRSPISGKLTKEETLEGSLVQKGMPLFTITDPKSIVIEVQIPAKDLSSLKIGSLATFKTGSQEKEVKLIGLSPTPDIDTLTSQAIFVFTNPKDKDLLGAQGFVDYTNSSKNMILLPESTLIRRSDKIFIRKFKDGKMQLSEIEVGERYEDNIEIKSGLIAGDEYILRASQHLSDGEEVQKVSNEKNN